MPCAHNNVRLRTSGQPFTDSNVILMATAFYCADCGMRFRALGVPEGVNHDSPGSTDEGEVTVFPIVPIDEEPQMLLTGTC